ncbi:hypothetical protein Tco_0670226 [Tanacetum coccineum]
MVFLCHPVSKSETLLSPLTQISLFRVLMIPMLLIEIDCCWFVHTSDSDDDDRYRPHGPRSLMSAGFTPRDSLKRDSESVEASIRAERERVQMIANQCWQDLMLPPAGWGRIGPVTWWNSQGATLGMEARGQVDHGLNCRLMKTEEFCPPEEIQRMEYELWNLKVKDMDISSYTTRFNELALLCPGMVPTEQKKAVRMAHTLMEQRGKCRAEWVYDNRKGSGKTSKEAVVVVVGITMNRKHQPETHQNTEDRATLEPMTNAEAQVDTSSKATRKRKQVVESSKEGPRRKTQRVPPQASKASGDASGPLNVYSDPNIHKFPSAKELKDSADYHWVVAHVTPPLWKQRLKEISLEKLYDIQDKAYMRQAVEKDKAYAELERKCNEALQGLEKNPLILDMHSKIETLQGQVDRLHEVNSLRQDRADVVSKVVPHVATELVRSDEMGLLVSRLVKAAMFRGRCLNFKEVAALNEPFILEKMPCYHSSAKKGFDQAGDDLATASYPFVTEAVTDPYATVEQFLLKKPKSLCTKPASSHSKPSSSKALIS